MKKTKLSTIFTFAGAIVAYLIGSGFASGQEALQFLASNGFWGCLGAVIFTTLIYVGFCTTVISDGYELQLKSPNDIFEFYCGKYLGAFFKYYTIFFLFSVYIVMISGAGAIVNEHYGINPMWGRVGMALLAVITVLLGLKKLVNVVSKIGPCIILFGVTVGVGSLIMHPRGLFEADNILKNITVIKASPYWWLSGLIFPSMGCVMITPFLAQLGKSASSRKEAFLGGITGAGLFAIAVSMFAFGLLADIGEIYDKEIPALEIANHILPIIGSVFAIILLSGIYTTAVPMLYLSCSSVFQDEKTNKFRISSVILTLIAFSLSVFPFATLVNILYTVTGYIGIVLVICIMTKRFRKNSFKKNIRSSI